MAAKRDYYEVLGLDKNASADDIKQAYRKAALKWHPDRHVDDSEAQKKEAEEKFKEASEAYSVLSDPEKKSRYDQFGFAGVDGQPGPDFSQGFGNLNELLNNPFGGGFGGGFSFSDFFGGGHQGGGQTVMRGRDIRTRVKLTLEEIASGCVKEVVIERNRPCPDCGGRGAKNASDIRVCPTCQGRGQIYQSMGFFSSARTCPQCGGEGKIVSNPCPRCKGTGLERKKETVRVSIPAGIGHGMQLSLSGEGHSAPRGGVNGNLLVVIEELPHPQLKREDENLFYTRVISVTDAMLGCEITVPCLDGPQKLKLEPGTQSGTVHRIRGKGLPVLNGYGKGDLFVKVLVWIPRKLKGDAKNAVEKLAATDAVKPDPSRDDKALFDNLSF